MASASETKLDNLNSEEDIMQRGNTIQEQWIPEDINPKEYFEIIVTKVIDPSKFFIQIVSQETTDKMDALYKTMTGFYKTHSDSFRASGSGIREGLFCAAVYNNVFHRALITKIFDVNNIRVQLIDYGSIIFVNLNDIRYLLLEFAKLPIQAVKASLANIIPIYNKPFWSYAANENLKSMTENKKLIGYIEDVNQERKILKLILTDAGSSKNDIHINEQLIENGHAVFGNLPPHSRIYNFALTEYYYNPNKDQN